MRGLELVELDRHTDSRGSLLAFGSDSRIPFGVQNVFFILDCPSDATRSEHATSSDEAIIALNSGVTVDLDNGSEREAQRLARPETALIVRAGVWVRLREFSRETALVVLSSKAFGDVEHFDEPNPALLDQLER